uniref:Acyltransferase 3 n=1 Tax=Rhodopseudomonas palustris (strain BisA53) TaxID=316055 RepID=Q07SL8_RHOP5
MRKRIIVYIKRYVNGELMNYRSIQYMRGIAATAVVIKHASHPGGRIEWLLDGGVDLFFIISGFVMFVSTQGRNVGPGEFLFRRGARIFPMWWLALITAAVLGMGDGSWVDWLLSALLIPSSVSYGAGHVSWGVGWTLVFEMIFYLIFAIGLAIRSKWFAIGAILFLVGIGQVFGHSDAIPIARNLTNSLLLEFMLGMLVAMFVPPISVLVGSLLVGFAIATLMTIPMSSRVLCLGLPIATLVIAFVGIERASPIPLVRPLQLLGDSSYSIYLFHYMAIGILWLVVVPDSYWPLTALSGVMLGLFVYQFAEKPSLRFVMVVKGRWKSRRLIAS